MPDEFLPEGYKTTTECWKAYPRLSFPASIGTRGTQQKRARNACVAAAIKGDADPVLITGPKILTDPVALWESKYPWKERPLDVASRVTKIVGRIFDPANFFGAKTGGDTMRSTAVGWRPPVGLGTKRFADLEQKATILGGLDALMTAGVQPWVQLANRVSRIPQLKLREDSNKMPVIGLVVSGARVLGLPLPTDLTQATEIIREQVRLNDLSAAAWNARGFRMTVIGTNAQKKREVVENVVSAATAVAAAATAWFPPVGLGLTAVSLATSAAGARTTAEKTMNQGQAGEFARKFEAALAARNVRIQEDFFAAELARAQADYDAMVPELLREGEKAAQLIQVGVWVGIVGTATLVTYGIVRRFRRE